MKKPGMFCRGAVLALLIAWLAPALLGSCSSAGGGGDAGLPDAAVDSAPDAAGDQPGDDRGADAADVEGAGHEVEASGDAGGDVTEEVGPQELHHFTYRAVGGISMGACGFTFHARHPGHFDLVAAYGGYINFHYLQDFFRRLFFGGFCDRETILAHLEEINDPASEALKCEPQGVPKAWEVQGDFNHWKADKSGGDWDRDFYWDAIEGIFTADGNLVYHNPEHPYLPPGVPKSWAEPGDDVQKCKNPVHVGKPWSYNAEYNPDGEYDLITFCDGEEPVPGEESNPDYWTLKGAYDPTYEHTRPVHIVLAVDFNGNGRRDYHEPIAINALERFADTGKDGCFDAEEDGAGTCSGDAGAGDANNDNYEVTLNPFGTEGDGIWEEGEAYEDFGLDGVAGTGDFGEGDGKFTINPNLQWQMDHSALTWIDTADPVELNATDILLDGGIRDAIHALTGAFPMYAHLLVRVPNSKHFHGYTEFSDSVYPLGKTILLTDAVDKVDWTAAGLGKNFIVSYGNPDATPEEIEKGDGKHVGTDFDAYNRITTVFATAAMRWPDLDWTPQPGDAGHSINTTFWSEGLQNRYGYSIALPPGYDLPESQGLTYPVVYFLPGHGMRSFDVILGGLLFNILASWGKFPKFILVVPEGQCCWIDMKTQTRYCWCWKNEDKEQWECAVPDCQGTHEECGVVAVNKGDLEQECNGGHFYANQKSNRWGDTDAAGLMRYEDMLDEMLDHVGKTYRVRPEGDALVPKRE